MARGGAGKAAGRKGRGSSFSGIKAPASGRKPGKRSSGMDEAEEKYGLDEVDAFHKQRDQVKLNMSEDEADSEADSELEAAAYDLSHSDSDNDEDESDGEESDEEEEDPDVALEAAIQRGGRIGKLAKAAKAVGSRVKLQQGLDEEEAEQEEEDDELERRRLWGASKRAYHGADDQSDDEEAAKEEEEEALRLQREQQAALRPEDYDDAHLFPDDEEDAESSEDAEEMQAEEATMGAAAAKAQQNGKQKVERIAKELPASIDKEEALAIIERDAPELLQLLAELRTSLDEVRSRVGPVLSQVKAGELATAEGVSYLEAKHLLLLSYCTHIVFYVLLKAEGQPVRSHPVIGRLLQLRTYLEKLRPIDKKLAYQIEKLLAAGQQTEDAAADAADNGVDPTSYGPRPDLLVPRVTTGNAVDTTDGGGVYRPPKLNPAAMDIEEDPDMRRSAKERRREREASRRGGRSALLQELAQQVEDAPEEQHANVLGAEAGMETTAARRQLHALSARAAVEEDLMMRVPLSKDQLKGLKATRRAALSGRGLVDDFADDVAELVAASEGGANGVDPLEESRRRLVSQRFGGELASNPRGRSGDEDLPVREALHERRAKFDSVRARHAAATDEEAEEAGNAGGGSRKRRGEQDVFYQGAAEALLDRKRARKEARAVPATLPPLPDPTAEGARKINTAIEKNRGLTPHRNKAGKNPRKKNRTKFEKASVRRKGQVQDVRAPPGTSYGGEATGIKSGVSKSRRF